MGLDRMFYTGLESYQNLLFIRSHGRTANMIHSIGIVFAISTDLNGTRSSFIIL